MALRAVISGLVFTVSMLCSMASHAETARQRALILIGPKVTDYEMSYLKPRIDAEKTTLEKAGYAVEVTRAADPVAASHLLSRRIRKDGIRALAFFGHGEGDESTILNMSGKRWQGRMFTDIQQDLAEQSITGDDAFCVASQRALNFGLDLVRNYSCYGRVDTGIADQFVRSGGTYEGVEGRFQPCSTWATWMSLADTVLDQYVVPEDLMDKRLKTLPKKCLLGPRKVFADPRIKGARVHLCLKGGSVPSFCGEVVAMHFCHRYGYAKAESWSKGTDKERSRHILSGLMCSDKDENGDWKCPSIVNVSCVGGDPHWPFLPVGTTSPAPDRGPGETTRAPAPAVPDAGAVTDLLRGN